MQEEPKPANNRNYQKELDRVILQIEQNIHSLPPDQNPSFQKPSLLLHACCAPCSSYVLEYLSEWFRITVFYYNPNITSRDEYEKRVHEIKRLIREMKTVEPVQFIEGPYEPELFFAMARGLEDVPEGSERCFKCYRLRLEKTAALAAAQGFDWFTTTLSISPLKNARKLNEIGEALSASYHVRHLPSDFKKKGGYQRSIELSREYDLYRQNYCGCVYSARRS